MNFEKKELVQPTDEDTHKELHGTMEPARLDIERKIAASATRGDIKETLANCLAINRFPLARWTEDPLRNFKNHLLTYSTILRIAVERNEIHPYYTAMVCDRYARIIEDLSETVNLETLLVPMIQDYCACVHNHSLNDYSPHVQKAINQINLHLSEPLSLTELARLCHVSSSYLSTYSSVKPARD